MSTLEDLKIRIVAVIGSEKNGCTKNDLCRIYKDMYGKDLDSKDYGFNDLQSLLASPTMQGEGGIMCENGRYFAAGDNNTMKMLCLIRNTKSRNAKPRQHQRFTRGKLAVSTNSNYAETKKSHETPTVKGMNAATSAAAGHRTNSNVVSENLRYVNPNPEFVTRHVEYSHDFGNLQSGSQRSHSCDHHSAGVGLQSHLNKFQKRNETMKSQKGKKRLVNLIEKSGGEMSFSEMKKLYRLDYGVPLDSAEICRLLNAKEGEVQDLYVFLKSSLCNSVIVTKLTEDDFLLTLIDDEDDIDEIENHIFADNMAHKSLPSVSDMVQKDIFRPNQRQYEFQSCLIDPISFPLSKTRTTANSYLRDSQLPVTMGDRYEYWKGSSLGSEIRSRDDYLPYKVLADKVLSFVRSKGSFKISNLSRIFYEEDGRHIDPKKYPEGTWEGVVRKSLSDGRHPELVVRDGVIGLRKDLQKSFSCAPNDRTTSAKNEYERSVSLISTDNSVPAATIYDLLVEAGRPLSQRELIEKLSARGITVNVCQLTVKLITKFKNIFSCEFSLAGVTISLVNGAKRPQEPTISSCLLSSTESVKIVTHVMSDYCSSAESFGNIFKSVLLINITLTDEALNRCQIQASFRLRSSELAYNSFEKKMCLHYLSCGQQKDFAVEKPIKDCSYAFYDTTDNKVYRAQYISDSDRAGVVLVYLIDEMRCQNAPISQLRKLTNDYAGPAYGVVAKTAAFVILPGRENDFREYFSLVRSKLLSGTAQDIQADVISEPSKNLFELKQLYSEEHNLNVPTIFVKRCMIKMTS
ncbi:unnamed protein product [Litomosoides sigmodontis]|uniref:HTH OST-type domain-containing protein n=1 Tax=Litomosoides sigmodontis TaxID=42156 RepID=A0A3P6UST2_LITSI|nr:unnamed protein product [Litomosoides sigmodontis]